MWKCKKCESSKFIKIFKEVIEVTVEFDADGVEVDEQVKSEGVQEHLECENCGNAASIFCLIEDIANYSEN